MCKKDRKHIASNFFEKKKLKKIQLGWARGWVKKKKKKIKSICRLKAQCGLRNEPKSRKIAFLLNWVN